MSNTGSGDCLENLQDPASDIDQLLDLFSSDSSEQAERGKLSVTTRMLADRDAQIDAKQV